jgi:hypothetical protein
VEMGQVLVSLMPQRAPGATANARAFALATNKIVADHRGIAPGWPQLPAKAGDMMPAGTVAPSASV